MPINVRVGGKKSRSIAICPKKCLHAQKLDFSKNYTKIKFHYILFVLLLECHKWSAGTRLRLPCVLDHAATLAMNSAVPRMKLLLAPNH